MTSDDPLFDVALTRAISTIINKKTNIYPCAYKSHLTVFPDKSFFSCHLLTNNKFRISNNMSTLKPKLFWRRYCEIENYIIKKFNEIKRSPNVWFAAFQDLCVAALLPPTKNARDFLLRVNEFIKYESYFWDVFLKEVYKVRSNNLQWSKLLENLTNYPRNLNVL